MLIKKIDNKNLRYEYEVWEDSTVFNVTKHRAVKPSKDKRRPNEPPAIYLAKKDGLREFWYHPILMATMFIEGYDGSQFVHHKNGDVTDNRLCNLYVNDGKSVLKELHHETAEWKKVDIGKNLHYDYYICEDGRLFNATTNSFIVPFKDYRNDEYARYNLYINSKQAIHYSVSRLVAVHFVPKPYGKDIVIFKDRQCDNVHFSNLIWGDRWDVRGIAYSEDREHTVLHDDILGDEIWKPLKIEGVTLSYEYLISNFGRVYNKSKEFYPLTNINSNLNRLGQGHKIVNIRTNEYGYVPRGLHRLVASTFCKNPDPLHNTYVNHINGNPECNLAVNLEWVTPSGNLHHAISTNLLHTKNFIGDVDEENWRMNTIMAWIHAYCNNIDKEYMFYSSYVGTYPDGGYPLTKSEYINEFERRYSSDPDFKKLYEYYEHEYSDTYRNLK